MKSMMLTKISDLKINKTPLIAAESEIPKINKNEVLVKINACAVCHTELDEIEGRIQPINLPVIPGHQIVGRVIETGSEVNKLRIGDRVGIGWINSACGKCEYCKSGFENLCVNFVATGKDVNGGYAEYTKINENYAAIIPESFTDEEVAPLLCAGAVGYRALKLSGIKNGMNLGFLGFGASNHLVLKIAKAIFPDSKFFVFARSGNERKLALRLGSYWSGDIKDIPPEKLHAVIDTTPVWMSVIEIMKNIKPGGRLVINNIRKEDSDKDYILNIDYARDLWMEKEIKSVANVAFADIKEVLEIAARFNIKPEFQIYDLKEANTALYEVKNKKIEGAKVLKVS
ncbi:MAG: alcohol dehydrogenase [Candidatus Acidulodesulfobacterium acidiphilum]|uniref:Alcohol dehydrogenase n=1 Tax=Candidatus Acidulodesulfobacterium acidiphilum TaxID=2597224 RepID=A0A520XGW4_9DELT|nr:MAG: alcohol dehydrogenase [Candidatus Acidulodesulfobacterium acidiphilum]